MFIFVADTTESKNLLDSRVHRRCLFGLFFLNSNLKITLLFFENRQQKISIILN